MAAHYSPYNQHYVKRARPLADSRPLSIGCFSDNIDGGGGGLLLS